jgi:hypothetical protein
MTTGLVRLLERANPDATRFSDDQKLIDFVKSIEKPNDIIPLLKEREIFLSLSDKALRQYLLFFFEHPECLGVFSRSIRRSLGIAQYCPDTFIMKESHIDINEADNELINELVALGFEPDHFFTLNPPEYRHCFTMRMEIPRDDRAIKGRAAYIQHMITERTLLAQCLIDRLDGTYAYLEVESYSDSLKRRYTPQCVDEEGLFYFPFRETQFVQQPVVVGQREFKVADLHVKMPMLEKGAQFHYANHTCMKMLRQLFLVAGFYEIRSMSGNYLYTVQLRSVKLARRLFGELDAWARRFGGITSIEVEVISHFWRKESKLVGRVHPAPIPIIVHEPVRV